MKLETYEKKILDSVERGEWRSARAPKRVLNRYSRSAKATFKKDRRLNIRISTKDLEAIQSERSRKAFPTRR
jgi:predicted DNA binding CopG/RHH family protein